MANVADESETLSQQTVSSPVRQCCLDSVKKWLGWLHYCFRKITNSHNSTVIMNSFGCDNRFSKIWYYLPILNWSWSCLNKCSLTIIILSLLSSLSINLATTAKHPAATIFNSTLFLTLSLSELHRLSSELWNHSVVTLRLKLPSFPQRGGTMQWEEGRWHAWRVRASGGQRSWITLSPSTDTMACLGLVLLAVQRSGMWGEQGGGGLSGS